MGRHVTERGRIAVRTDRHQQVEVQTGKVIDRPPEYLNRAEGHGAEGEVDAGSGLGC